MLCNKVDQRDYIFTEFPLAFGLLQEACYEAYQAATKGNISALKLAINTAVEYGELRSAVRILREDPDRLLASFIARDEECEPDEDGSDSYCR